MVFLELRICRQSLLWAASLLSSLQGTKIFLLANSRITLSSKYSSRLVVGGLVCTNIDFDIGYRIQQSDNLKFLSFLFFGQIFSPLDLGCELKALGAPLAKQVLFG